MIAHVTDTEPHEFILQMGDAHIYANHVEALKTQLEREPRDFPQLKIRRTKEEVGGIDGFRADDFEVVGYKPCNKIEMAMSVSTFRGSRQHGLIPGTGMIDAGRSPFNTCRTLHSRCYSVIA